MTFATAIACLSWLLFSVTPILLFSLSNPGDGLADGGRAAAGTLWRRLGANLVVLELCTAMILLVGAGLLGKSFYHLLHTDIGFQPDHLAMLRLTATRLGYPKDEHLVALAQHVMSEIARLPGVRSAAISRQLPVGGGGGNTAFQILGRAGNGEGNEANSRQVSANYFATVQARLLRGRYFDVGEDASKPRVAIVNQAFARKYFAGEDPVGKQIRYDESEPVIQIVGVVDDIKEGPLDATTDPALYALFNQEPHETFFVVVRTSQEPRALLATLVGTIHQIDPGIMTSGEETMVERINHSQSTYLHRSSAWVGGGFAAVALLLGMVGLYGVVAYSVSQRTREIGVRMALGAQRGSVYQLVLGEAGRLIAFGLVAGLICAVAAATLMRKLLFGTQPWDVPTLVAVATVLTVSALSASYIPARRAASVNPVEALRAD